MPKTTTTELYISYVFCPPNFNLDVNIWREDHDPSMDPPDVVTTGNLAWGKRVGNPSAGSAFTAGVPYFSMTLLLPALTDIRGSNISGEGDTVEVPAGSGRFYQVNYVDDLGKGFSNEHRGAIIFQDSSHWPEPTP